MIKTLCLFLLISYTNCRVINLAGDKNDAPLRKNPGCNRLFYYIPISLWERTFLEYRQCFVSSYMNIVDLEMVSRPDCQTDLHSADVIIPPLYLAREENWPVYGGLPFVNTVRSGMAPTKDSECNPYR